MKTKLLILASLLNWAYFASADETTTTTKEVEIMVNDDGENVTKKIIVNGKQLTPEEIEEFEANGHMKTLHLDHDALSKSGHKVMVMKSDGTDHANMEKHIEIIKKHSGNIDNEDIQVFVTKDGDETTEKVVVNGKELSEEEIAEFKASGKMKVINIDSDMMMADGHKRVFINSDSEHGEEIDIDVIMEKIKGMDGKDIDESMVQEWINGDGKNIKIISKSKGVFIKDDNSASLGFMANVEDDGWHLTKIIDKSGAKDVGILVGDIVTRIGEVDLIKDLNSEKVIVPKLPKFEEGEIVKVEANRAGQSITFNVPARVLDKSEMVFELKGGSHDGFNWIEEFHENGDLAKNIKVMVFDNVNDNYKLNEEDIHMVFPEKLDKMNFFISDGQSTSKLLGKNHEMSSLSDDLGKYFNTSGGVLVLHVDESNVFNLRDGDVIKSINDVLVQSPKDVVKQLINADDQEKIKMEVVRNKKSKTLKYQK